MRRTTALAAAVLAIAVTACGAENVGPLVVRDGGVQAADYSYEIPRGAGEAFDRGEPLDILPGRMEVEVGEVLELVNHDDRGHLIGPFYVDARETLRQRFSRPGEFVGICSVHPSGEITLVVSGS